MTDNVDHRQASLPTMFRVLWWKEWRDSDWELSLVI